MAKKPVSMGHKFLDVSMHIPMPAELVARSKELSDHADIGPQGLKVTVGNHTTGQLHAKKVGQTRWTGHWEVTGISGAMEDFEKIKLPYKMEPENVAQAMADLVVQKNVTWEKLSALVVEAAENIDNDNLDKIEVVDELRS